MTENAIQIENLTKAYPKFKLQNLNLTLPTGCILGLIGENGAGKSTTIRLLLKLLERDSGKVELLGTDIDAPEFISRRNDIGVVLKLANSHVEKNIALKKLPEEICGNGVLIPCSQSKA